MDFSELLDEYRCQEHINGNEGRRGVEALATVARAIGYKDTTYFGQLSAKASIGDLINFLEDNSGCVDAMFEWMEQNASDEWKERLKAELPAPLNGED